LVEAAGYVPVALSAEDYIELLPATWRAMLQDLRRSLLDPPRQLRPRTVTAARDDERAGNVGATA
jgi:hypothetical protein